jgi:GNAT superfamily N-acetyltransferase
MRLCARAFVPEPWVIGMFGDDVLDRFAGTSESYTSMAWSDDRIAIGAFVAGALVGVAGATRPGRCRYCDIDDDELAASRAVRGAPIEDEFDDLCIAAHRGEGLPVHARIAPVAAEPALQGAGIGRAVVAGIVAALLDDGASCIVLECNEHNAPFYEHAGFRAFARFREPSGPMSCVMRLDG